MDAVENNLKLMKTLDDAWNEQDWETFLKRHAKDTIVTWMGRNSVATKGREAHKAESIEFFKTFPDNHIDNDPYKVLFGQGDWTCSVARFTGTMKGPMAGPDGKIIPPTNKKFEIEFFKTFPDNHIDNDPYKVLFGQGDWTCSVARFTGTMKGPMAGPDGKMIPPTNKKFEIEFCTVAHWVDGEIVEEKLFYDLTELMRQIGVVPGKEKKAA